ncbi:hypothetical protein NC652_028980 [Populus alba x Populus x berolinensis]|nr:hypothetical protein NC652_028980 [Populus alba x Populus x berolinensis]
MGTMTASSLSREASNYDEVSMQQSLLFSDSLKDLKNLRSQLYSAAEYFELSYTNDDQKQIVVETLKDYAIKALVNTVDHLGSVTYKVNDLLDEKVDEVSGTEFRVCCIEQVRMKLIFVGETMHGAIRTKSKYQGCSLDDEDDWHQFRNAVRATIREAPSSARETPTSSARETPTSLVNSMRKGRSPSPSPRPPPQRSANVFLYIYHAQKRSSFQNHISEAFHLIDFHSCVLVLCQVGQQLQIQVGLPLQALLLPKNGTLPSLENQHPCVSRLKRKIPKTLNNIPAKVSVSSKPYLAGANQRKMKCYILTWTNIESKSDEDKKAKGGDKE